MLESLVLEAQSSSIPVVPVTPDILASVAQDPWRAAWVSNTGFSAKPGQICLLPNSATGQLAEVWVGVNVQHSLWALASLPAQLPAGTYRLQDAAGLLEVRAATLGFVLGSYRFDRYKKITDRGVRLAVSESLLNAVVIEAKAIKLARDLINTPAEDMGPADLAHAAQALGQEFAARVSVIVGDELLKQHYPAIHMVGRAGSQPPCLIDVRWGNPQHPRVTLVGKGVCFDTGGLDIKSADGMLLMKKDMGGAALALATARMIMASQLPVCLRVLIPAVENNIAHNAYRPGDVVHTRKGLTIEINNTDAEGRVILADALAEACNDKPELLIDFATLTGAARVALGPDVPALFSNQTELARALVAKGDQVLDPLWHMPLHAGYREMIDTPIADLTNSTKSSYAGAITAALLLQEFVDPSIAWVHLDVMAWNVKSRPGRPEGGEAMSARAVFAYLEDRFKKTATLSPPSLEEAG